METRFCTKCGREKSIEEFGWKDRPRGKRHAICKTCTAVRSSNWYYQNQERQKSKVKQSELLANRTGIYSSIPLYSSLHFLWRVRSQST